MTTMLPTPEVRDELTVRALALVAVYFRGDLEALDALVDDNDAGELLVTVTEVLTGALLRLVGPDELERQVDAWLDERRTRLADSPPRSAFTSNLSRCNSVCVQQTER